MTRASLRLVLGRRVILASLLGSWIGCEGPTVRLPVRSTDDDGDISNDAGAGGARVDGPGDASNPRNGLRGILSLCNQDDDCTNPQRGYCGVFRFCVECLRDEHCGNGQSCNLEGECGAL